MFWDFVLMQFSPFVQFRQKYKTSKQHSLAAILKNRQLVNNASTSKLCLIFTSQATNQNA